MPGIGFAQQASNPTDLKSALGISGDTSSPAAASKQSVSSPIAHSKHAKSHAPEGWREKWLKKWRADHENAAKKKPEVSAAPHVAHPAKGSNIGSPLSEKKKLTLKSAKTKKHEPAKTLLASHKQKSHSAEHSHVKEHSRTKEIVHAATLKPKHHKTELVHVDTDKPAAKLHHASLSKKKKRHPKSEIPAAVAAAAPPVSVYGQTKPDGFTAAPPPKDHTQNSPLGAVNDSGKLMFLLIPTLAVLVGVLHLLRKYMEKSGRLGRSPSSAGSGLAGLSQWKYPKPQKLGLVKSFLSGLQKTTSIKKTGSIHVIESIPIGNTHLHLVEVRGRTLLLGANTSGINLLTELEDGELDEIQDSFHAQLHAAAADLDVLDLTDAETPLQSMVSTLEDVMRETREAVTGRTRRLRTVREDEEYIG